jgi:hypothetical protein
MRAVKKLAWKLIHKVSSRIQMQSAHDIGRELQARALSDTCKYVEERLGNCAVLSSSEEIIDFALQARPTAGFFCEFGVFRGRSINYIARKIRPQFIHGFDSFEGLPEDWRSGYPKTAFQTNVPPVEHNVELYKGWFESTLPGFVSSLKEDRAAIIHIDCDLYSSTRTIFEHLGGFLVGGSVVIFDEYFNYPGWREHEHKALQEFCAASNKRYEYLAYNRLHEQVVIRFL